jgi:hypothetical protein
MPHHPYSYMGSAAAEEDCTILRGHNGPFMTSWLASCLRQLMQCLLLSREVVQLLEERLEACMLATLDAQTFHNDASRQISSSKTT